MEIYQALIISVRSRNGTSGFALRLQRVFSWGPQHRTITYGPVQSPTQVCHRCSPGVPQPMDWFSGTPLGSHLLSLIPVWTAIFEKFFTTLFPAHLWIFFLMNCDQSLKNMNCVIYNFFSCFYFVCDCVLRLQARGSLCFGSEDINTHLGHLEHCLHSNYFVGINVQNFLSLFEERKDDNLLVAKWPGSQHFS